MKFVFLVLLGVLVACKPQEQNQQQAGPQLTTIGDYKVNPDDVILYLTVLDVEKTDIGWNINAEVKKQIKAGFGYKNRLSPGEKIVIQSRQELSKGDSYCAVESELGGRSFTLKTLLKK